ncbi:hypothetical protein NG798_14050 [Ancylothrix sp. C2]|uniref:hypothetical protein n=1 Tax=Ancylothrix sp. D3o TaxID=2953691 RepID=UPI0021BB2040|nr:hypothetical protein [Ancylothrix sp. D3o]MCT7950918.1 hypothetical protein [Ancylothrix sp. D3o]
MDSGSIQPANSSEPPPQIWGNRVGTLIALFTLIVPLWIIGSYSSSSLKVAAPVAQPMQILRK